MKSWEITLQRVDRVLYQWMKEKNKHLVNPPGCIEVLEEAGIYSPSNRPGKPLRDDLREARKASRIKDSEPFGYCTAHLKFEQEAKKKAWLISIK